MLQDLFYVAICMDDFAVFIDARIFLLDHSLAADRADDF